MKQDRLAKFCGHCGTTDYREPFTLRAKVPEYKSPIGTVPAWYAWACSPECLTAIKAGIAADQAAIAHVLTR